MYILLDICFSFAIGQSAYLALHATDSEGYEIVRLTA